MVRKNAGFKIIHIENPLQCYIVNRANRFVVKVRLAGNYYQAYINNTGRLHQFLVRGKTGFCLRQEVGRKTDLKLFSIKDRGLGAIIDTQLQMRAFEKSLEMRVVPWLKDGKVLKRNARLGNSLIDYLLECGGEKIYLEVKSAVLREDYYAMYPDCPSARGRKHITELSNHVRSGGKAIILFIAALPRIKAFKPNRPADPELYQLLIQAHQVGVKIESINMIYHPEDSFVYLSNAELPVNLS